MKPDEPVWTTVGMKLRRELKYRDDVTREDEHTRCFTRVWTYEGQEVRRDNEVQFKHGYVADIFSGRM